MVIGVATRLVIPMICHELEYLQRAFFAIDVWDWNIGFPGRHRSFGSKGGSFALFWIWIVCEEAVSDNGDLRRALNGSPN